MFSRLLIGLGMLGFAAVLPTAAMAYCSSYPNNLANGSAANAAQVMANFGCAALTSASTIESLTSTNGEYFTHETDTFSNYDNTLGLNSNNFLYLQGNSTGGLWLAGNSGRGDNIAIRTTTHEIDFNTNNGPNSLVINSTGKVGIGFGSPQYALTVNSQGNSTTTAAAIHGQYYGPLVETEQTSSSYFAFAVRNGAAHNNPGSGVNDIFLVRADGNVGIGTSTPSYTLHVNGSVAGTSAYNNLSDIRLKKNITPIRDALAIVSRLKGVRYQWRDSRERPVGKDIHLPLNAPQIGFVAQDLQKVVPEAVSNAGGRDSILSVAESKVVPILVEAVKELKTQNDEQAREILSLRTEQEAQIGQLKAQLASIEHRLVLRTARN